LDIWTINIADIVSVFHQLPGGVTGKEAPVAVQNMVSRSLEQQRGKLFGNREVIKANNKLTQHP